MKVVVKVLAVLLVLLVSVGGGLVFVGSRNLSRMVDVPAHAPVPQDGDPVEGQRLAVRNSCAVCHGGNLGGATLLEAMPMANLAAPNLTGGRLTDEQLERAIRHGVGSTGRPLMIMPALAFQEMSDQDLADIIAYIQSIPRVETDLIGRRIGPIGRVAAAVSPDEIVTALAIEHGAPHPTETPVDDGSYLTALCRFCHGQDLGGKMFVAGEAMWAANLTPHSTGIGDWDLARFRAAVQDGVSGNGTEMDPNHMPWSAFRAYTEEEFLVLWEYLNSLPSIDRSSPDD